MIIANQKAEEVPKFVKDSFKNTQTKNEVQLECWNLSSRNNRNYLGGQLAIRVQTNLTQNEANISIYHS